MLTFGHLSLRDIASGFFRENLGQLDVGGQGIEVLGQGLESGIRVTNVLDVEIRQCRGGQGHAQHRTNNDRQTHLGLRYIVVVK